MNKKGFTLIEVMVSLAILAIILVALAQAAIVTIKNNAYFDHRKVALELARGTISSLTSLPYSSTLLTKTTTTTDTTFLDNPTPDPDNDNNVYLLDRDHNGSYSSSDVNDSGDADKGIDHPSGSTDYSSIQPIEVIGPITYYKIWGIEDLTDMKKIVVVVYWFESNNPRRFHYVSLTTYKRSQ